MRRSLAAWISLTALLACARSPQTHFFALNAVSGPGAAAPAPFRVQVAAVHLPPSVDRRQLVRMTGQNRVEISETERWSAPLDEMTRNVLAQDLVDRLPAGMVVLPDAPAPAGTRLLVVTLAQFGPDTAGDVTLAGSWSLLDDGSKETALRRDVRIAAGPARTADATAAAMSRALGELAGRIASDVSATRASGR